MEEIKDFELFYSNKLAPFLKDLQLKSNDTLKWSTAGIASIILSIACFAIDQPITAIFFIILLIISIIKYYDKKNAFTYDYKKTIINEVVKYLNPQAVYNSSKMISSKDYKKSGLFSRTYNYYEGEDLIKGVYKNVRYYCSEVQTKYTSINESDSTKLIFRGLFFAAPINSIFNSSTYIWPADDVQLPESLADEHFKRFNPLPGIRHIKMNNREFENYFIVYSTNPAEARSLVDNIMMERMLNFRKQIKRDIRFSFVKSICYVAIAVSEDFLEPSVSRPENKEEIKDYFFSVLLILSVINQLHLSQLV